MSNKASINQLLSNPGVWQAARVKPSRDAYSTGYSALDSQLYEGGWPKGAVSELLLSSNGVGELRLLAPLMRDLSRQSGYLVLVNPPFQPYAPALQQQGIQLNKLLLVRTQQTQQAIWAAYQALVSQSCAMVLTWLPEQNSFKNEIRKLSLGARQGGAWSFVLRNNRAVQHPSAAKLRVQLSPSTRAQSKVGYYDIDIVKQPGGWDSRQVTLELLPEQKYWTAVSGQHWTVPKVKSNTSSMLSPELMSAIPESVDQWLTQVEPKSSSSNPSVH